MFALYTCYAVHDSAYLRIVRAKSEHLNYNTPPGRRSNFPLIGGFKITSIA